MGTKLPNYLTNPVKLISTEVDFADLLVENGSALAAADVFEVISIPAKCLVIAAGINPVTAANSTTLTVDLGDGDDVDRYTDGFNAKQTTTDGVPIMPTTGAAYAQYAGPKYYPAADTIDIVLATLTGTLTKGKIRVWAVVADIS